MKAVLISGGLGTRLGRLTNGSVSKQRLPVYDKPMIEHVVECLVAGGCDDILVLLNGKNPQLILESLEEGSRFGCQISYKHFNDTLHGPVRHFLVAEKWVGDEPFVLMLGDSFFVAPLQFVDKSAPHIWTMPLGDFDDPRKYGQVQVSGSKVTQLVEKPEAQFSDRIQTGVWLFPPDVFEKARAQQGKEGELHFGDLSMMYVNEGRMTHTSLPPRSYIDLGTPEALLRAANIRADMVRSTAQAAE